MSALVLEAELGGWLVGAAMENSRGAGSVGALVSVVLLWYLVHPRNQYTDLAEMCYRALL